MKFYLCKSILIAPLLALISSGVSGRALEIRPLVSSSSEFRFTANMPAKANSLQIQTLEDGREVGFVVVTVAVPNGATVRVRSIEPDSLRPTLVTDQAAADRLAALSSPFTVRGRRLVNLRLYPFTSAGYAGVFHVHLTFEGGVRPENITLAKDPHFDRLLSSVVANAEAALSWPRQARSQIVASGAAVNDLTLADQWFTFGVNSDGLHRLTGAQMSAAGISLTNLQSSDIRIFNSGGLPLEVNNMLPRASLDEIAILIQDGGDGQFDSGDQLFFFAEATDRWVYEVGAEPRWVNNIYTTTNTYWLAVSGSFVSPAHRMTAIDGSRTGLFDTTITEFIRRVHSEQENLISLDDQGHFTDYYNWYWTNQSPLSLFVGTPGALAGGSAEIYIRAHTSGSTSTTGYIDLSVNAQSAQNKNCNREDCGFTTVSLLGGPNDLNQLDLTLQKYSVLRNIPPYLNYIDIAYPSRLSPLAGKLDLPLGASDLRAEIRVINDFSSSPLVLDLRDPQQPIIVNGAEVDGGEFVFEAALSSAINNRFHLQPLSTATSVAGLGARGINDLRAATTQADLLIVTSESLAGYLDEYVTYRQSTGYSVRIVTVEDIMENFAYGTYDPTAIRDYLKFAYENFSAPAPSVVLFVGDANFDFTNNYASNVPNYVPSYILNGDRAYSDDNFVYFGSYGILDGDTSWVALGDRGFDMMAARWPVRSRMEIDAIVAKLKAYQAPENLGAWKTKVTLVADDEYGASANERFHVTQTEQLEDTKIPRELLRQKIYLWEFPFVNRDKPAVNDAIVEAFNNGTLLVNYVGHGNPDVWAHEHVLNRGADLPKLTNSTELPLVFAASCAIGFFDDPAREGMAEDFLWMPSGGAIAVISATRLVYSSANADFNRAVFGHLLSNDSLSMCEAMFAAKLERQYPGPVPTQNDRAYAFFGDPFLKLADPKLDVVFDQRPDSLLALGRTMVSGWVRDALGDTLRDDGTLHINVFDSDREIIYRINNSTNPNDTVMYDVAGAAIFRGSASIIGGSFAFDFITPLDIGYGGLGGRISAYAQFDSTDGLGVVDSIPVSQTLVSTTDSLGPQIGYRLSGRAGFQSGDVVHSGDQLEFLLADSSGINLSTGIGHGITIVIDGDVDRSINVTSSFAYEVDSYVQGRVVFALAAVEPGEHTIKIKAWDNANNLSTEQLAVTIDVERSLAVSDLLNYPNPMGERTTFYFDLSQPTDRLNLEIFTLAGRKIFQSSYYDLAADSYPNGAVAVTWDGHDRAGDRVGTGVYMYKVTAVPLQGGKAVEEFGKIVVVN